MKDKRRISDKMPRDLMVSCVGPLSRIRRQSDQKSISLCIDIRDSEGHGDLILATLEKGIVKFRKDASILTNGGFREAFDGNRANALGVFILPF